MLRRQSSLLGLVALLVLLVVVSIPSQSCASPDVVSQKVKRSTFFFAANKENVNKDETVNTSVDVDADSEGSSDESSETEFEIKSIVEPMSEGPYVARLMHPSFPRYSIRVAEPKVCDENVRQYSGYLDVDKEKHFFFWFFESRSKPSKAPLVLWLNGGPGCSSLTGLFMELGPCTVSKNGNNTIPNKHSWNNHANMIFLDQPVNTGFSYSEGDQTSTSEAAAKDVYAFLQIFLATYPKYAAADFHVFGESYAGHYIPAIGHVIHSSNSDVSKSKLKRVHLKSLGIGNGLVDPLVQFKYYPDMACNNSYAPVLDDATCEQMRAAYPTCANLIKSCYRYETPFTCVPSTVYCENQMFGPYQRTGLNPYDVREKCGNNDLCYDILTDIEAYLNRPEIQKKIGVSPERPYKGCNMNVNQKFLLSGDWMRPYVNLLPPMLDDGVRILVYAGDADYICNWIGNKAWTLELEWKGKTDFVKAADLPWIADGKQAGEYRMAGPFAFLRVFKAGHMVPYNQPKVSLEMFEHWIGVKSRSD